jgi:hypothetical protein
MRSKRWTVIGVACLAVLLLAGIAWLAPCSQYVVGIGYFDVSVSFEPPLPMGVRVSYDVCSRKVADGLAGMAVHPELRLQELPLNERGTGTISVPFSTRRRRCFGGSEYIQSMDAALIRFDSPDGQSVLQAVALPTRDGPHAVTVTVPRTLRSP